ncbi:UDP-2,4-diacetamido-2,4,6-trideoxy-beta-L-altropyranose hydrolase [Brevibacillus borstelensis]|uniref:UDP-2,4-diacetamido-2,4, 6-trideoxy-beta-L-altropyranose hydrolase n=1 Tax=Brevibacillus borstelensis TaxID=45462 RepID=UPI002E1F7C9B|nr:UDP-2,4-diacetamido-2,4,6-trideoxy-beta-L-altropyranose hydrolase [Brevibacillus borstelensis]MED1872994.1 UDP-2,4-diacetamido-2,4,6-trideoxy-beta-L-altropyranose hydrolase [Brevibacillus borstelensis]
MGRTIPHTVIRADASITMGTGHIMRCMTLAKALRSKGWQVTFITRAFEGNLIEFIENEGFKVYVLPEKLDVPVEDSNYATWLGVDWSVDAKQTAGILQQINEEIDWLVVDHYAIDEKWESVLRTHVKQLFVIDDLANRVHNCDVLLDQNVMDDGSGLYSELVSRETVQLLGPRYALLRPEFTRFREPTAQKTLDPNRILVFFGGSDAANQTQKALDALIMIENTKLAVDVVVGKGYPFIDDLRSVCLKHQMFSLHVQTTEMARLLSRAGIVVCAGGTNTWERCCLGAPSVIVTVADNQVAIAQAVHNHGMALYLGKSEDVTTQRLADTIHKLQKEPALLSAMSEKSFQMVDGKGVDRVVSILDKIDGGKQ